MGEEDTLVQSLQSHEAQGRRGRAFLTVLSGREVGQTHRLGFGESIIGRGIDADVQVVDEGVSRRHAKIIRELDGTSKIVDLRSTNGTFVNGKRIQIEVLREGDRIRVGASATLDFRYEYLASGEDGEARESTEDRAEPGSVGDRERSTIEELRRTLEIREDSFGPNHPAVASILDELAAQLRATGQATEALPLHERAIRIYERRIAGGPEPPELAHLLTSQAETQLVVERSGEALTTFERALEMLEKRAAEESELASARFGVARALTAMGREPLRARTLASLARDGFNQTTGGASNAEIIQTWLDDHDW